ncbi:hypothetical protein R1sor_008903 [Riccia sorocarpa]|uniref:TF-B3 domain-containing protein n=1 Tax=Riccia sorocarpa TaxID=122646 RepID=A0ABD3HAB0_9MARC
MEGLIPLDYGQKCAVNCWSGHKARSHLEPLRSFVKKEMGDGSAYVMMTQQYVDDVERQRVSPEAEAGEWIRDEPVDGHSGLQRSGSSAGFAAANNRSLGSFDVDGRMYPGTKNTSFCVPSVAISSAPEGLPAGSSSRLPDLTEDAMGPTNHLSNLPVLQEQRASLFAQLRGIRIKENVIRSAIERLGGGQKGLRALVKFIMLYLRVKNGMTSSQATEQFNTQEPLAPVSLEEIEKLNWNSVGCLENGFSTSEDNGNNCNLNDDMHFLMNPTFGVSNDLKSKEGHYAELANGEKQMPAINEYTPGALSRMLEDMGVQELGVQGSGSTLEAQPTAGIGWNPRGFISDERQRRGGVRRLSPSPDRVSLSTDLGYEDSHFRPSKIRRVSPLRNSSTSSCELPAYSNIAQPVSDVFSYPNPFVPFSISPSSPSLDHHMELGSFGSFAMQGLEETPVGFAAGMYSRDSKVECQESGVRLGIIGKSKAAPAAHTRLARKNRMDRNRKSASLHSSRSVQSGGLAAAVIGTGWVPPSASVRAAHSQCPAASEGQSKLSNRREMGNIQYLLQKMLKPSDVGNLGRIVLPKKDAESHLPWLGAREGIAFQCEDYDTGDKLNLRYRFWPNNKSRMYLLENTGEFVKKHNLEEGDRLMIYKNVQDDSFIIRGRKAHDCGDQATSQVHIEDKETGGKEVSSLDPPVSSTSSRTSSIGNDGDTREGSLEKCVPEEVSTGTGVSVIASQDDLFADLPDAPMGDGTEPLVRFPSLEAFDELLGMVPAVLSQQ